ncbi:hypothetical protein FNF28_06802 [Cafeteria roenbergensis]|uniref:Uncharacterized protein n=1 Tax=Cafeteria roenbergensis TaxID=33653 RepID=A0A5A8CNF1_CAFRO|nr:hypothetical protein FNF28_06802 [Cafeteria roenbergensis]
MRPSLSGRSAMLALLSLLELSIAALLVSADTNVVSQVPTLLADINKVQANPTDIRDMTVLGDKLYLSGSTSPDVGIELVSLIADGKYELAASIADGDRSSYAKALCAFNNKLYFFAGDATTNHYLRVYDPATKETRHLPKAYAPTYFDMSESVEYDGEMFFGGNGPSNLHQNLWAMNSSEDRRVVYDFPESTATKGGAPHRFTVAQGQLYFLAQVSEDTTKLYSFNRTHGVRQVAAPDFDSPSTLAALAGKVYFSASDQQSDRELWVYDGVNAPYRALDINPHASSSPRVLGEFEGKLYLEAAESGNARRLFVFNGTHLDAIADVDAERHGSDPDHFTVFQGEPFLTFTQGDSAELFKLSRSGAIVSLPAMDPATDSAEVSNLVVHDGQVFFAADDGVHGSELWKYNSSDGASMQSRIRDKLYFAGNFPTRGSEVGSYSKSEEIKWETDIAVLGDDAEPSDLCSFGSRLFFAAGNDGSNVELWVLEDGGKFYCARDVRPGWGSSSPKFLTVANNTMYFLASNARDNVALYSYSEDDEMNSVLELSGGTWSDVYGMASLGGQLYMWWVEESMSAPIPLARVDVISGTLEPMSDPDGLSQPQLVAIAFLQLKLVAIAFLQLKLVAIAFLQLKLVAIAFLQLKLVAIAFLQLKLVAIAFLQSQCDAATVVQPKPDPVAFLQPHLVFIAILDHQCQPDPVNDHQCQPDPVNDHQCQPDPVNDCCPDIADASTRV